MLNMINRSKSQTLITGVYRTGSEYLTQLINCNTQISATMYTVNILRFVVGKYDDIAEEVNYKRALDDINDRLYERYNIELNKEKVRAELAACERVTYGILYDVIMCELYLKKPVEHWAEKNQLLWREIPEFLKMMPNGKVIHVIRDPRAVLLSFKKYTFAEPPAYLGAIFNCFDSMRLASEYKKIYSTDKYYLIRYEDLVSSTEAEIRKIWEFLGLNVDNSISDRSRWVDAYGNKWHANSSFHDNDNKKNYDTKNAVSRWQEHLLKHEIELTEYICEKYMNEFGYEMISTLVTWENSIELINDDQELMRYFQEWKQRGVGIESFPLDPLEKSNWEENRRVM